MTLPRSIRVFLLSILCFFLNLPIGIDVPGRCEVTSCTLDNGAVVCEQSQEGYTFDFTIQCRQLRRPVMLDESRPYHLRLKVFDFDEEKAQWPDDVINYHFDESELEEGFDPKDYYRENILYYDVFPALESTYKFEFVDDPILVREGDEYAYSVHVVLPADTPAGTYSVTFEVNQRFGEFIYRDILMVP